MIRGMKWMIPGIFISGALALAASGMSFAASTPPYLTQNNIPANPNFSSVCLADGGNSNACTVATVQALDNARQQVGLGPIMLPTNWNQLTQQEQLFVLVDIARVDRGITPISGLNAQMDQNAQLSIPNGEPPLNYIGSLNGGTELDAGDGLFSVASFFVNSSNTGLNSTQVLTPLMAIYEIMYNNATIDPNYGILASTVNTGYSHWHARAMLLNNAPFDVTSQSPLVAGAGYGNDTFEGAPYPKTLNFSFSQVVGGPPPSYIYTWQQALAAGANSASGWNPLANQSNPTPTPTPNPTPSQPQYPVGSLWRLNNNPAVYIVTSNEELYHIPNGATFNHAGLSWSSIHFVSQLPNLPITNSDPAIPTINPPQYAVGSLWKTPNNPAVYIVTSSQTLYHVPSALAFNDLHLNWSAIQVVSELPNLPMSTTQQYPPGSFYRVAGTSPVYIVTPGNTLYHVPNPAEFVAFGGTWSAIHVVSQLPNLPISETFSD